MTLCKNERNTILAALRAWQVRLLSGKWPSGDILKVINDTAGEGADFASPEDIDNLCEKLNTEE